MMNLLDLPCDVLVLIFSHLRRDQLLRRWLKRTRERVALDEWWGSERNCFADDILYQWWSCNPKNWRDGTPWKWSTMTREDKKEIEDFSSVRRAFRHKQGWEVSEYDGKEYPRPHGDPYIPTKEEDEYWSEPHHKNHSCNRCNVGYIDDKELKIDSSGDWYCPGCETDSDEDDDY